LLATVSEYAAEAGVTYVLKPLAPPDTNFINTVADAVQLITSIGNSVLRTMIDTCAAGIGEASSIPQLIDQWLPTGTVAHVHLNDINRLAPGQGRVAFAPILTVLLRNGYAGVAAVEPFKYQPDGPTATARAIGYLNGILEGLSTTTCTATQRLS